jgi:hypothetical protein
MVLNRDSDQSGINRVAMKESKKAREELQGWVRRNLV